MVEYAAPLSHFPSAVVLGFARFHLLPESYLMGLVDVKRMASFYPTFLLGKVYAHGQWYYFPLVILIKTTLGMLALFCLSVFAMVIHKIRKRRKLIYVFIPAVVYLAVAMLSGMNIGARHLLPMYAFTTIFAAAGVAALATEVAGGASSARSSLPRTSYPLSRCSPTKWPTPMKLWEVPRTFTISSVMLTLSGQRRF